MQFACRAHLAVPPTLAANWQRCWRRASTRGPKQIEHLLEVRVHFVLDLLEVSEGGARLAGCARRSSCLPFDVFEPIVNIIVARIGGLGRGLSRATKGHFRC